MLGNPIRRCDRQRVQQAPAGVPISALLEINKGPLIPATSRLEPGVAFGCFKPPTRLFLSLGPLFLLTHLVSPPDRLDLCRAVPVQIGGQLNPSLLIVSEFDRSGQPSLAKTSKIIPKLFTDACLIDLGPEQRIRRSDWIERICNSKQDGFEAAVSPEPVELEPHPVSVQALLRP